MDIFNAALEAVLRGIFAAFRWSPGWGLAAMAAAAGVGMQWVFRKAGGGAGRRAARRQVQAHLLELRLYGDEPGVMWQAQKSLAAANLRYLALMLRPALLTALPMAVLLVHLDAFYGRAPLAVGAAGIVTVGLDARAGVPELEAPPGVAVETPAVRALDLHEVSWRIRPRAAVSGRLRIRVAGGAVEKDIEAGGGPRFVAGRKVRSAWAAVWHPDEARIAAPQVNWVEIGYPAARVEWLGLSLPWLVWFTGIAMLAALGVKAYES